MITIQPREPGPRCAPSASDGMTCVTPTSGNRHTADHHQRETSAPESARQNRYTNPLHTASADRRHSYITHLIEFGYPERFAQDQAGHSYASTTAIYTGVSDEFRNRLLAKALREKHARAWEDQP
jgi:site-specific recombinase XerC